MLYNVHVTEKAEPANPNRNTI